MILIGYMLLLQMICDADCLITNLEAKWPGSVHDSRVFCASRIYQRLSLGQVKSSHLYLYSAFNNTDCVKALNGIKLEDRVSVMYNNK